MKRIYMITYNIGMFNPGLDAVKSFNVVPHYVKSDLHYHPRHAYFDEFVV